MVSEPIFYRHHELSIVRSEDGWKLSIYELEEEMPQPPLAIITGSERHTVISEAKQRIDLFCLG